LKDNPSVYKELDEKTEYLHKGLDSVLSTGSNPYVINRFGSMISVHFSDRPVNNFAAATSANNTLFNKFFHAMLNEGVYLPPSAFETWFISTALSKADIDETIEIAAEALSRLIS
jgi:glutamate-1-semialdehyde 2,1-aminomutase